MALLALRSSSRNTNSASGSIPSVLVTSTPSLSWRISKGPNKRCWRTKPGWTVPQEHLLRIMTLGERQTMSNPENTAAPESTDRATAIEEHRYHSYSGNRIPWYVRLIWIGFWIFAVYYVIAYLFPDLQSEIVSPP